MADNNLDIRARLTGEDHLSSTVVKLLAKIKSLEAQMKKLGDAGKNSIDKIPMENYVKQINAGQKALNGLTKKHLDWAKANGVAGSKANQTWNKLTKEIERAKDAHEQYSNSTARGSKKRMQLAADELKNHYKNAQAFKYLFNKTNDERLDLHRRTTEQMGLLEAAHLRNVERQHRSHFTNLARMRRDAMRGMQELTRSGSRAGMYAAAGAAATGFAGASAFKTRMKVDTAETNLKMFGGFSDADVREMRKSFGNQAAIKYGLSPDKMIDAFTEVIKAGVPKNKAKEVTDAIVKSSTGLDLDTKEATRFATRVATLTQDMKNLDPAKLKSIMNAVTISGMETAADPNEIIAANRRASGVFASSKFSPEDLSAFTSTGVSVGLPSAKTGTFMGFLVNELVGARNARGQRAKDLGSAANLLGLGGRNQMSAQMAANPADTLMKIFEKIGGMSEQRQNKILTLLGMREWRDELAAFVEARENLKDTLAKVRDPQSQKIADEINDKKLKSLAGRWKSFVSAMTLIWESVGAGFEKAFGQITDFFTDYLGRFDTSKITQSVEAFTDGMVAGLGYDSWTSMLKAAFGNPDDIKNYATQFFSFSKGFMEGFRSVIDGVIATLKAASSFFGNGDNESLGKLAGEITALVAALAVLAPVLSVLSSLSLIVNGLAASLSALAATTVGKMILSRVGASVAAAGGAGGAAAIAGGVVGDIRSNSLSDIQGITGERKRLRQLKELQRYKTPADADPFFTPTSYRGSTDFSGRRRSKIDDLAGSLDKYSGNIVRAAFMSGGTGGGLQYAFAGGGGGGGGGGSGVSSGGGSTYLGNVPGVLRSTPGSALPQISGRSGIIRRDNIPSFKGTGGSVDNPGSSVDTNVGAGLGGNAFAAARRARFAEEIKNDPTLALHLAAMQETEGASRGGTIESAMNRADMMGWPLRKTLGMDANGVRTVGRNGKFNSFYGPIRRGEIYGSIRRMQANPKLFEKYDAYTKRALAGSHIIGGYNDQGLPTDPNGSARTGIPGLRLRGPNGKLDGNEFTDWNGGASSFGRGRQGSINYRKFFEQGINNAIPAPATSGVPPAQNIQNVPSPIRGDASMGLQRGGSSGPVAIHINGNSHDPEALATLVQRRIDESMNWRTHDTSSEYA